MNATNPDGLVPITFPWLLHILLEDAEIKGFSHVVSWLEGGTTFKVHNPKEFADRVMPCYFNQTRYKSFQRQLNSYRFRRFVAGENKGTCYHQFFMRDKPELCRHINRMKDVNRRWRPLPATAQQQTLLLGALVAPPPPNAPLQSKRESSEEDALESDLRKFNSTEVDPLECPSATMFDDEEEDIQLGRTSATSNSVPQQGNLDERAYQDEINSLISLFDNESRYTNSTSTVFTQ
jgi:hypothetical protein